MLAPQPRTVATPREPQHRDRAAAHRPRGAGRAWRRWCSRWPCAAPGQIAELADIAEPDVGVVANVGPVHLELLGSIEAIAAAKAELIAGLRPGGDRRSCPPASRCSTPTAATTSPRSPSAPGGDVERARRRALELAVRRAPTCAATRSPRWPRRAPWASSRTAVGRRAVELARPAHRAARRHRRHQRLLQRQPDVDARRTRRPRRVRARAAASPCSATCSSSGPTRTASTRRSAPTPATPGSTCSSPSGRAPRTSPTAYGDGHRRCADAAAAAAAVRGPARARRHRPGQGLARRRPRGRRPRRWKAPDGRGPHRRHGGAAHLHLPLAALHRLPAQPRVRPVHPRGGPGGPPREGRHADDGRDHHLHRHLGRRS